MLLSELPPELIATIYRLLYDEVTNTQLILNPKKRRQWSLQLLTTCMVCQSWYTAGSEYLSMRHSMRPYFSYNSLVSTVECPTWSSTHSLDWNNLLMESKRNNLHFHHHVRQLAVDLSYFTNTYDADNSSRRIRSIGKSHSNAVQALMSPKELEDLSTIIKRLFTTCTNLETLEIVYDPRYTDNQRSAQVLHVLAEALLTHNDDHGGITLSPNLGIITDKPASSSFLSRLVFTARESMERCPCCAGRGWDHLLLPLLQRLRTTTLVLDHVLPSRSVLECLSQSNQINTLVIRGDILTQTSRFTRYSSSVSSPSRIPMELLSQLTTLEIYLYSQMDDHQKQQGMGYQHQVDDDRELYLLMAFRQIHDIIQPINSLQRLILHGRNPDPNLEEPIINKDIWNKMELLAERQHLNCVILENIPGFQCPDAQSKLKTLFKGAGKVVYTT